MSQQNWGPGQGQQAPQNNWNQAPPPAGQAAGGQSWGQAPQGAPQGGGSAQGWGQAAPPASDASSFGQTANNSGGWNGNPAAQSGSGYGSPAGSSEIKKLESDANMWLIVVLAGFFFGFGWATGPAGWYFGSEMRKKYRSMGMEPAGNANLTYFGGIVSTVLYYGTILLTVALLVIIPLFFVGAVVTGAALQ
jgi:hypothetical protein